MALTIVYKAIIPFPKRDSNNRYTLEFSNETYFIIEISKDTYEFEYEKNMNLKKYIFIRDNRLETIAKKKIPDIYEYIKGERENGYMDIEGMYDTILEIRAIVDTRYNRGIMAINKTFFDDLKDSINPNKLVKSSIDMGALYKTMDEINNACIEASIQFRNILQVMAGDSNQRKLDDLQAIYNPSLTVCSVSANGTIATSVSEPSVSDYIDNIDRIRNYLDTTDKATFDFTAVKIPNIGDLPRDVYEEG